MLVHTDIEIMDGLKGMGCKNIPPIIVLDLTNIFVNSKYVLLEVPQYLFTDADCQRAESIMRELCGGYVRVWREDVPAISLTFSRTRQPLVPNQLFKVYEALFYRKCIPWWKRALNWLKRKTNAFLWLRPSVGRRNG